MQDSSFASVSVPLDYKPPCYSSNMASQWSDSWSQSSPWWQNQQQHQQHQPEGPSGGAYPHHRQCLRHHLQRGPLYHRRLRHGETPCQALRRQLRTLPESRCPKASKKTRSTTIPIWSSRQCSKRTSSPQRGAERRGSQAWTSVMSP